MPLRRFAVLLVAWAPVTACGSTSESSPATDAADASEGAMDAARDGLDSGDATDATDGADTTDTEDADPGPPLSAKDFCAKSSEKWCAFLSTCWSSYLDTLFPDAATCSARLTLSCVARSPTDGAFRGDDAAAHLACLGGLTCDDLYVDWSTKCVPPRLVGAKPLGGSCGDRFDCESRTCAGATETACGKCATPLGTGDTCAGASVCAYGAYCAGTCQIAVGVGAACDDKAHFCYSGSQCKSGTCVKNGGLGTACTSPLDCDLNQWVSCNRTSGKCEKVVRGGVGDACPWPGAGPAVECGYGMTCVSPTAGTCVAEVADGEPCTTLIPCQLGARCRSGKCTMPTYLACP